MAFTKVQVVSMALLLLGQKRITSLDNQSDIVNSASDAYDFLLPVDITKNKWRFAIKPLAFQHRYGILESSVSGNNFHCTNHGLPLDTASAIVFYVSGNGNTPIYNNGGIQSLALSTTYYARGIDADTFSLFSNEIAANNNDLNYKYTIIDSGVDCYIERIPLVTTWSYIYYLPDDFLSLERVTPQTWDFEIFTNNELYTNINTSPVDPIQNAPVNPNYPFHLNYVFQPEQNKIPDLFLAYYAYEIASFLALSNAQYAAFYDPLQKEREMNKAIAMAADAQNRPQTPMVSQPMISNRSVTGLVGINNG